jgi:hypothetical protein
MKTKFKITKNDYLKAIRKGSRDAEIENSSGWKCTHKIHKSANFYNRKNKHKKTIRDDGFFTKLKNFYI